ncbi:MAG: hypothetical protein RIT14_357 [Pseudomonadota bacterium]|jgi:hypothetical protein
MSTYSPAASGPASGGILALPRRVEAWLDARGRGAWIAAMVLGFIAFWPVGLALVAYMTYTNRWSRRMFATSCRSSSRWGAPRVMQSSGNSAFDAYKAETLRRLEEEQAAFEGFLNRLREAKDKQEFDAFMADRSKRAAGEDAPAPQA